MLKRRDVLTAMVVVCLGALLLLASAATAAELKVGVMNVQEILVKSTSGKAAKVKFDDKMKELQGRFKVEEEELIGMQKDIEKKSSAWSEATKQEKILEFQKKRRDLKAKTEDARFELKGLQDKELAPILKALEKVVVTYGEANGFTMILDSQNGVIFFNESVNITDKIIVELDAAMAK